MHKPKLANDHVEKENNEVRISFFPRLRGLENNVVTSLRTFEQNETCQELKASSFITTSMILRFLILLFSFLLFTLEAYPEKGISDGKKNG